MKSTGLNEEQAVIKLTEANGDIDLAMGLLVSEQEQPRRGTQKRRYREDAVQMFMAMTGLPTNRAMLYLEDPRVNYDINKAKSLFNRIQP